MFLLVNLNITLLVRPLMYGFGDDINPRQDTVELVEDLMIEYVETIVKNIKIIFKFCVNFYQYFILVT